MIAQTAREWSLILNEPASRKETHAGEKELLTVLWKLNPGEASHANGRSLVDHLVGTRDVLRAWKQPDWLQTAGLFHSVYSTEFYQTAVLSIANRPGLRALIGAKAERIVYLFCVLQREDLIGKLRVAAHSGGVVPAFQVLRTKSPGSETVLPWESFALSVLLMANECEQQCERDGSPSAWLSRLSELQSLLDGGEGLLPPVFGACKGALFTEEQETTLLDGYRRGIEALPTDPGAARRAFEECAAEEVVGEPLLWLSFLMMRDGQESAARRLAARADALFDAWGTAWDKRMRWNEWRWAARRLSEGQESLGRAGATLSKITRLPEPLPSAAHAPFVARDRLISYLEEFGYVQHDMSMSVYPGLSALPSYDPSCFPIVEALEQNFAQIREEARAIGGDAFRSENEPIDRVGAWNVYFFHERGRRKIGHCLRCPTIARIMDEYDPMCTMAGGVFLSKMDPHTRVAAHLGPTNMRVRCHFGLRVPEGDCAIRCGDEVLRWKEGKCIVINDALDHEVWNLTPHERLILIVDLWHPELTAREINTLRGLQRYVRLHAGSLLRWWVGQEKKS